MTVLTAFLRSLPGLAAVLAALAGAVLPDPPAAQGVVAVCPEGEPESGGETAPEADLVVPPSPVRSGRPACAETLPGDPGATPVRSPSHVRATPFRTTPSDPTSTGRGVRLRC